MLFSQLYSNALKEADADLEDLRRAIKSLLSLKGIDKYKHADSVTDDKFDELFSALKEVLKGKYSDKVIKDELSKTIFNMLPESERLKETQNIDYILDRYDDLDMIDKEHLGRDSFYQTLVTSMPEVKEFNFHSDYWGSEDEYQEKAEELMSDIEPYIGQVVEYTIPEENETYKVKINGIYIDKQYNSHLKLAVDWIMDEAEEVKESKRDLPSISKFIYDLDGEFNNWSVQDYTNNGNGQDIIIVSRNGKSNLSAEDIISKVEEAYPQLKGEATVNGRSIWFYLRNQIKESDNKNEILSKIFAHYPDLSEEDEDFLNGLSYEDLITEIKNRGWYDVLKESVEDNNEPTDEELDKFEDEHSDEILKAYFDKYNNGVKDKNKIDRQLYSNLLVDMYLESKEKKESVEDNIPVVKDEDRELYDEITTNGTETYTSQDGKIQDYNYNGKNYRLALDNNMNVTISIKEEEVKEPEDTFEDSVYKDFQEFLDDHNITEPTEDDINDYFTGKFYDIETEEDLDDSNRAEDLIRNKYLNKAD